VCIWRRSRYLEEDDIARNSLDGGDQERLEIGAHELLSLLVALAHSLVSKNVVDKVE
jgi:hypothetical protein